MCRILGPPLLDALVVPLRTGKTEEKVIQKGEQKEKKNVSKVHRQSRKHAKALDLERKITQHGVGARFLEDVNEAGAFLCGNSRERKSWRVVAEG